ncbi:uncharacterized protein LOC122630034 [Vespula pensylvanica]|uniref:uncharacterized protein LOC122630034 n=1 Tax=Vespula pensylvanica TaxID=30213 RepID=UPI001CB9F0A5|nr:uncharacterized protein LOC122630034 [Vespula pensylvanica]
MINSQEELQPVCNKMKLFITFDFIPKLLRCITFYIRNCIDKVVHYQKDIITRRLKRRKKRLFEGCNYRGKNIKCKCDCNRCTKYRNIHSRILETGFMSNICNNRPTKNEILNTTIDNNFICCTDKDQVRSWTLEHTQPQDHRDVYFIIYFSYLFFTWIACLTAKFIFHINWTASSSSYKCSLLNVPIKL